MSPFPREYFTIDLRGLRAALTARAADAGLTESEVLRSALAVALAEEGSPRLPPTRVLQNWPPPAPVVKLSVRIARYAASHLDQKARLAGLSRGAYLTRLIAGAPPVVASADRAAGFAALNESSTELALFSRDINHLTRLLRESSFAIADAYRERLDVLDRDVRMHLDRAAAVLAGLSDTQTRSEL